MPSKPVWNDAAIFLDSPELSPYNKRFAKMRKEFCTPDSARGGRGKGMGGRGKGMGGRGGGEDKNKLFK